MDSTVIGRVFADSFSLGIHFISAKRRSNKGTIIELCELTLGISSNLAWNQPEASRDVLISGRAEQRDETHGCDQSRSQLKAKL